MPFVLRMRRQTRWCRAVDPSCVLRDALVGTCKQQNLDFVETTCFVQCRAAARCGSEKGRSVRLILPSILLSLCSLEIGAA